MRNASGRVIVIGAGLGGLSASIYLAKAGFDVTVLEKNAHLGGKMNELISPNGFRFDTGPTLLTMPFVFESLFEAAGRSLKDYLTLIPLEASCRYFYPDGTVFTAYCNHAQFEAEFARVFPNEREKLKLFMAYAKQIYDATAENFIYNPLSFSRLFKRPLDVFKIDPFTSVQGGLERFFKDPRVLQFFGRFPTYVGASPYLSPATLNVIAYVELAFGSYYIRGGMQRLADAYATLATELGVRIETNRTVTAIVSEAGRVKGVNVRLDGEEMLLPAMAVVSNDDAVHTYTELTTKAPKRIATLEPSCSGYVLCLGVEGKEVEMHHHNIFFTSDYKAEFEEIFQKGIPPKEPTIYLTRSCHQDPEHAPEGCENWFLLINAPALSERFSWESKDGKAYRDHVLDILERRGIKSLRSRIRFEACITPQHLKDRYHSHQGSIYGISSNDRTAAFLRPQNRSPYLRGLYLATGSAHPGGGTPMVTLSGKFAAQCLIEDFGR